MRDLFDTPGARSPTREVFGEGAVLLRAFAAEGAVEILGALEPVLHAAPFRNMVTPGGFEMSVAMSNCGDWGWTSDRGGYRYSRSDPVSGRPWPPVPAALARLAQRAAEEAGYPDFHPDACLINRYQPGAKMSLHQDKNERDMGQPIVSLSLGLPAVFLFGGLARSDPTRRLRLEHGDVAVWGGPSRLHFHGILPLRPGDHPLTGRARLNLTFRKAG